MFKKEIVRPCLFLNESDLPKTTSIYRYLSLESFLFLLVNRNLTFSKAKNWPDAYEGVRFKYMKRAKNIYPEKEFKNFYGCCWSLQNENPCLYDDESEYKKAIKELERHGSASMWETYCKNGGVRVKTTIKKLDNLLKKTFSDFEIYRGKVQYEPQKSWRTVVQSNDWINLLFVKRVGFRYESEYRYLLYTNKRTQDKFVFLPIGDLYDFFDEILICPAIEKNEWISKTLYNLCVGLTIDPRRGRTTINNKNGKQFCRISQLYSTISEII